jgi:predicted nuclease of predicted toxin-antitoxin system
MKVLLDECVTRYLKRDFTGHEVFTIEEAGFKGLKNGRLLQAASRQYDVLVTVDQNLQYQQNLKTFTIAVVVMKAKRSTYPMLKPLIPHVLAALEELKPGEIAIVS